MRAWTSLKNVLYNKQIHMIDNNNLVKFYILCDVGEVKELNPITFLECSPIMCKKTFRKISKIYRIGRSTMSSISEFLEIHKNSNLIKKI